jgi:hypothetical protein
MMHVIDSYCEDFKLRETEAGDVLFEKEFKTTPLAAEKMQAERWNENYCRGEPRVKSELFRKIDGKWSLVMSMGADD